MIATLEFREVTPGLADDRLRHAREPRDLQAVALVRRPFLHGVQEHERVAVLGRVEVHVLAGRQFLGERGQLEVVRGEERVGADLAADVPCAGPGERQAVVGAGAAADLVHQHEAVARRVVQDVRRLGHLDHEGGAPAGEIVRGADAREDAVHRPDRRRLCGNVAAESRENHDQRRLPHVRGLAAHVGPGDDQHPSPFMQREVVRHERALDVLLDHRMAPATDVDARLVAELGLREPQRDRALGEVREHVERGERGRRRLQARQALDQPVEQALVELALAGQCAVARAEHAVLERLELLRDVALGVLDGLAAHPVGRDLLGLAAAHLDVVALHPVVAETQVGEPGALALARLQLEQRLVAVLADPAQLVEVGIEARRDHAAVAQQGRRRRHDGRGEQCMHVGMRAGGFGELHEQRRVDALQDVAQFRQAAERVAQPGEVARAGRAQRDAREDALDVADAPQQRVHRLVKAGVEECLDGLQPMFAWCASAQRTLDPAAQLAAAHGSRRVIEHADQRAFGTARQAAVEFQVAARGGVEQQRLVALLAADAAQVRQRRLLRVANVLQQAAGGADGQRPAGEPEAGEVARAELLAELPLGARRFEVPGRPLPDRRMACPWVSATSRPRTPATPRGAGARARRRAPRPGRLKRMEAAARQLEPRQAEALADTHERRQQGVAALLEQRVVRHRSRRDDAHHLPLDRALGFRRVADLLADRDRLALAARRGRDRYRASAPARPPSGSARRRTGRAPSA